MSHLVYDVPLLFYFVGVKVFLMQRFLRIDVVSTVRMAYRTMLLEQLFTGLCLSAGSFENPAVPYKNTDPAKNRTMSTFFIFLSPLCFES